MKAQVPSDEGYAAAAWLLMVDVLALKAIAVVESGAGGAFRLDDQPTILFERHLFHKLTDGRFDALDSDISNPLYGGYGPFSVQHNRLQRAAALDRSAALQSASWGLYQILGLNHAKAGYPSLQRFVNAMYRSADDHLRALTMFIRNDERLVDALRAKDWRTFASIYNGPAYARNRYDVRMDQAYRALVDLRTV